jgi:serine/threonine-protein kinase
MGVVYLALDPILQRLAAIKVLSPHLSSDETVIARFINEARIAASLQHPNIVTVYEAGQDGDFVFMAMEYVEGQDLATLLRERGRLHPDEAIAILKAVASALDYAHQRGVIHRDVKPSNVLVSRDGVVKLMDFGIARVIGGERHTKTGVLVGTPEYMAPELWEGKEADKMADLYALGVMAYEMLTGEVPFTGDTPIAIGYKHVHGEVPRTGMGGMVDEVMRVAMAKERERRFQSGMALVMALEKALEGRWESPRQDRESVIVEAERFKGTVIPKERTAMQSTSLKPTPVQPIPTQPSRKKNAVVGILVAAVIVLSLVGIAWKPIQQAREKARQAICISNLRDLGMAVMQYCQDYDERMPLAYNWADAVYPYFRRWDGYQCPSRKNLKIGYAYNRHLNGISMEQISQPTETVCLFESNLGGSNPSDYGESWIEGGVHLGGNFVSFVDGHTKWYSWTQKQHLQFYPILSKTSTSKRKKQILRMGVTERLISKLEQLNLQLKETSKALEILGLRIQKVWVEGEKCACCGERHGKIFILLSNGKIEELTPYGVSPKISEDGFKVGWLIRWLYEEDNVCEIAGARLYDVTKKDVVAMWDWNEESDPPEWVKKLWTKEELTHEIFQSSKTR